RCERVRHSSIRFPAKPGSNSTLAALVEPQNGDSLLCEIALIIECAGIAEVSRRAKFGRKSEPAPRSEKCALGSRIRLHHLVSALLRKSQGAFPISRGLFWLLKRSLQFPHRSTVA